ncbi:hypothetical protein KXR87_11585 [Yokenella regensburgei]|uniref:hypothetical protein n=1 Tax=Yokenella regensburgei TaxID=158877 RepID=UPI003F146AFA
MQECLYEDDENLVLFQKGTSDFLLITFNHMGKPGRRAFWGQDVAEKLGITCIGVVPKHPHWYPYNDVQKFLSNILKISENYKKVILYGFSMGAYASLKFSSALGATTVLSFSPQIYIDPDLIQNFDKRYEEHFDADNHSGMKIYDGDCISNPFIFYDPEFSVDLQHIHLLPKSCKPLLIETPNCGHNSINAVLGTEKFGKLISLIISEDNPQRLIQKNIHGWS